MADGGLLLIFRSMTTEQLLELKQTMIDQITGLGAYTAMAVGGKSFTRDIRNLQAQLEALVFVLNERSMKYEGTMITDFSGVPKTYHPPGTTEDLNY